MEIVKKVIEFVSGPWGAGILLVLLSISELLALNPKVKSNSIFQAIVNAVKWIKAKRDQLGSGNDQSPAK